MSLSESLSSMQTTRLMKMNSLPGTEDLRYMLVTAKESRKMVELPFKHPNGNTFLVKVVPPQAQFGPKWTFCTNESGSAVAWTRESTDVMMIQNKIKIDSISSSPDSSMQGVPAPDRHAIVFSPGNSGANMPAFPDSANPFQNPFQNQESTAPPVGNSLSSMQNLSAHGWVPQQMRAKAEEKAAPALPPPVELDSGHIEQTMQALLNPDTGLTDFVAFDYFLQREFANFKKSGSKMAVVMFDYRDLGSNEVIDLPPQAIEIVLQRLRGQCTTFDVSSRMNSGEFCLLLAGLGAAEAVNFAETLWKGLTEDFLTNFGEDPRILAMGISSIPEQCQDPGVLLATAQVANSNARKAGLSHLLFSLS